jgi:acetoin utilization deacetylase AcuC-like enzyme
VTTLVLAGPTGEHEHDGGARHPEQPARLVAVMEGVAALGGGHEVVTPLIAEAPIDALARVHDPAYLAALEAFCKEGGGALDADTYARPDSWRAARRAVGAGLAGLSELERRRDAVAFVAARPPGHHATADRAMGFCLLNSIAVAAASRTARGERVLIVDWDVHHGNGTQDIFWNEPDVLYVSTHQHPLYPGTGRANEVGGPAAPGSTLNLPLPPGATGDVVRHALDRTARAAWLSFSRVVTTRRRWRPRSRPPSPRSSTCPDPARRRPRVGPAWPSWRRWARSEPGPWRPFGVRATRRPDGPAPGSGRWWCRTRSPSQAACLRTHRGRGCR